MSLSLNLYKGITGLVAPLVPVLLRRRLKRGKEDPRRLTERLGVPSVPRPSGPLVWLHGASVGETVSILPLVARLQEMGLTVLMTSGTVTSAEIAAKRLPERAIHQFVPVDTPKAAERFIAHWQPDIVIFAESELWPNLLAEAGRPGIVMGIVNGRMSEKSCRTWQRFPGLIQPLLRRLDFCLAQSDPDAQRYRSLGVECACDIGNLKYDVEALPVDTAELAHLRALIGNRPVLVAASTHPGEDESVILAHRLIRQSHPEMLTIIAPRHPVRGEAISAKASAAGCLTRRRAAGEALELDTEIYIADTIGELGLFYRLADVAFLGGSFIPHGGQNPIEPAKLSVPALHGPYVFNFTDVYAAFDAANASARVDDGDALALRVTQLLSYRAMLDMMRTQSKATAEALGGALARTLAVIRPYAARLSNTVVKE